MRFLGRREHSREELKHKLARLAEEGDDVEALLDDLATRGWLSDARYAEHAIRSKARRYGPVKLAHVLRAKGIDDEAIAAGFRAAGHEGDSNVEAVWKTRFHAAPADDRERARHIRFLQGRGFRLEEILRYMKTLEMKP